MTAPTSVPEWDADQFDAMRIGHEIRRSLDAVGVLMEALQRYGIRPDLERDEIVIVDDRPDEPELARVPAGRCRLPDPEAVANLTAQALNAIADGGESALQRAMGEWCAADEQYDAAALEARQYLRSPSGLPLVQRIMPIPISLRVTPVSFISRVRTVSPPRPDAGQEARYVDVVLSVVVRNKVGVIKVVRDLTGLGLKAAQNLVDEAPSTVVRKRSQKDAEASKSQLEAAGATVELRSV